MIQDLLTDKKYLFASGANSELRAQWNLNRRAVLLNGDLVGNVDREGRASRRVEPADAAKVELDEEAENAQRGQGVGQGLDVREVPVGQMVDGGGHCRMEVEIRPCPRLGQNHGRVEGQSARQRRRSRERPSWCRLA